MKDQDYTTTFSVDQNPEEVFGAINNVRGWWTGEPGIEGRTDRLGDEFTYRQKDVHYSRQRVAELIPGKKVVWLVTEANLNFIKDKSEWKGTKINFDISTKGSKTEIRFTHVGLAPQIECYDVCSDAWRYYIRSNLRSLITTGKGEPYEED